MLSLRKSLRESKFKPGDNVANVVQEKKQGPESKLVRELGRFRSTLSKTLEESDNWSMSEWKDNAGLYADVSAVLQAIFVKDCFCMFDREEPVQQKDVKRRGRRPKNRQKPMVDPNSVKLDLKQDVWDGYGFAARFLRRLSSLGGEKMAYAVKECYNVGMSWPARSMDTTEIASMFDIAY